MEKNVEVLNLKLVQKWIFCMIKHNNKTVNIKIFNHKFTNKKEIFKDLFIDCDQVKKTLSSIVLKQNEWINIKDENENWTNVDLGVISYPSNNESNRTEKKHFIFHGDDIFKDIEILKDNLTLGNLGKS